MSGVGDILEVARKLAQRVALPVCFGCPDGAFERAIEKWLYLLVTELGSQFTVRMPDGGPFSVVDTSTGREFLVAHVTVHQAGGKQLEIIQVKPETPRVDDRDRIGEILEKLMKLEAQVVDLREQVRARDIAHLERVQRLMLLVHHFGQAPWVGHVELPFGGSLPVTVSRPGPEPKK